MARSPPQPVRGDALQPESETAAREVALELDSLAAQIREYYSTVLPRAREEQLAFEGQDRELQDREPGRSTHFRAGVKFHWVADAHGAGWRMTEAPALVPRAPCLDEMD